MQKERHFLVARATAVSAVLATLCLVACQQSQTPNPAATSTMAEPKTTVSENLYVLFEGPWAIVPDPKDANSVLAIAPKTKSHRPLAVVPASKRLEPGVYDLSIPARPGTVASTFDKNLLRANVNPQSVQHALETKLERYVIRLPKPDAYLAESRFRSRVGGTYPPEASTEQEYATSISLRYAVTSKAGLSLAGTKDVGGALNPVLIDLGSPFLRFEIETANDVGSDACSHHSRQAFHDLAKLLGMTLYVDFPDSPIDCRKADPQLVSAGKAQASDARPGKKIFGTLAEEVAPPQQAGLGSGIFSKYLDFVAGKVASGVAAAIYFFHTDACRAPIVVGSSVG